MSTLPESRTKRYLQKISHGRKRINHIQSWLTEEINEQDTKTILAIEKACQEAIEVSTDMLAMILKDQSIPPKDDYTNIGYALDAKLISDEIAEMLKEANGLRNRLIHVYNDIDIALLLESIRRIIPGIVSFLSVVEKWLNK